MSESVANVDDEPNTGGSTSSEDTGASGTDDPPVESGDHFALRSASMSEEAKGIRFSAWLTLVGVILTLIGSNIGTYYLARENITASRQDASAAQEVAQNDLRRTAYTDFLVLAQEALRFERTFWCRIKSSAEPLVVEYTKCPDAPDGSELATKLRASVATIYLDGSESVRGIALGIVSAMDTMVDYELLVRSNEDTFGFHVGESARDAIKFRLSSLIYQMSVDVESDFDRTG